MQASGRLLSLGFGYLIYYDIDKVANVINVVTIQHPKRDRPYSDK